MTKITLIACSVVLITSSLTAQPAAVGNWLIYFGNKKISEKWNWHYEVQYRNFNLIGDTEQLLLRTGIGYNLSHNNNNIHLGYAYVYSEPYVGEADTKTDFHEHRLYQQFITRQEFGRFAMLHRYRFEQRFVDADFRLRLRYFLSLQIALNQKQLTDNTVYISAYNEIFVHTRQDIYDRNRLYAGLGYRWSPQIRAELGLMRQSTPNASRNQVNLITFVHF